MKRFLLRFLLPILASATLCGAEEQALRILCWNLHHGKGMDGKIDLERIAKLIDQHKPDIVMLQEVDKNCRRSGKVDQAEELGRLTKLHHAFGKAMDYDGGEYGQAILSRYPLTEIQIHTLPGNGEPRIAISAQVETPLGTISIATIHLDYKNGAEQLAQAQVASAQLLKSPHPVILAGDFNAGPESKTLSVFAQAPWSIVHKQEPAITFPADHPKKEIDHLILRGLVSHKPAIVIEEAIASDHRPIMAIVTR